MEIMKKEVKRILTFLLVLSMIIGIIPQMSASAVDTEYKELKFGDWSVPEGSIDLGDNIVDLYSLNDRINVTSLDGVAISGKVNFKGFSRKWMTIGGVANVKHGGFWMGAAQEYGWAMACQGIGTGYGDEIRWSEAAKFNATVELRLTFNKTPDTNTWTVKAYGDGVEVGAWTYQGVTPGLYIGIPRTMEVDMTPSQREYQELDFSDWSVYEGTTDATGIATNLYRLPDEANITSLDGVAISGKVNFNGQPRNWLTIGGTDDLPYAGFWLGAVQENGWTMACQGIGTGYGEEIRWNEAAKFNTEVLLRITFDKASDSDTWTVKVHADGELVGQWTYSGITPGMHIGVPKSVALDMPPATSEPEYQELQLSDWSVHEGTADVTGCVMNLYRLPDEANITSLDGVAISGKVNFNGQSRNWLTIGGTDALPYAGFWLGAVQENGWAMACQGIGTGYGEEIRWSEAAKFNTEVLLRITFDKAADSDTWTVKVYADGEPVGQWTYSGITPGMHIGVPTSITTDMPELVPEPQYRELKFSDWTKKDGTVGDFSVFCLNANENIKSLDGVAISGAINFNGNSRKWLAVGGTEEVKNGGFWLGAMQENGWTMIPQGIGGNHTEKAMWSEKAKFDSTVTLRLTFDKSEQGNTWTVGVYIDGTLIGTHVYEGVNPGMYISAEEGVSVEGIDNSIPKPIVPEFSKEYKELTFSDFGMYMGEVEKKDIYSLKGREDIESLNKVAVSGKVKFGDVKAGELQVISIGGTDKIKHAGFWLFSDGECLRLSPQGIGADVIDHHVMWADAWGPLKNSEFTLRMTFNRDSATKEWWVGIFIDGSEVGLYNCGKVTPGLYVGVDSKIAVEGLGDIVKNSGLDFTLFGYSNRHWRKEMGLK